MSFPSGRAIENEPVLILAKCCWLQREYRKHAEEAFQHKAVEIQIKTGLSKEKKNNNQKPKQSTWLHVFCFDIFLP